MCVFCASDYHVGGEQGWSPVFGFKTVPAGTTGWPLRLAVYGDLGATNAHSLVRYIRSYLQRK